MIENDRDCRQGSGYESVSFNGWSLLMNIDLGPDDLGVASMQDAVIGLYSVGVVRLPSSESRTCMNQCIAIQLFSHEFSHSESFIQSEGAV